MPQDDAAKSIRAGVRSIPLTGRLVKPDAPAPRSDTVKPPPDPRLRDPKLPKLRGPYWGVARDEEPRAPKRGNGKRAVTR